MCREGLSAADRARYEEQHRLIQQITAEYAREPNDAPRIFELIQAMQVPSLLPALPDNFVTVSCGQAMQGLSLLPALP